MDLDGTRNGWSLRRRVLPQHTDHAGVMWHGAYLSWLEEARVEALSSVGLAYSDLSAQGLELPVVALSIEYRQPLLHGDVVEILSVAEARVGIRLPWSSRFLRPDGTLAAQARVDLVLVEVCGSPAERRLLRRPPEPLAAALEALTRGPASPMVQMY